MQYARKETAIRYSPAGKRGSDVPVVYQRGGHAGDFAAFVLISRSGRPERDQKPRSATRKSTRPNEQRFTARAKSESKIPPGISSYLRILRRRLLPDLARVAGLR